MALYKKSFLKYSFIFKPIGLLIYKANFLKLQNNREVQYSTSVLIEIC